MFGTWQEHFGGLSTSYRVSTAWLYHLAVLFHELEKTCLVFVCIETCFYCDAIPLDDWTM